MSCFCNVAIDSIGTSTPKIAARDHDAVTCGENFVVVLERIGALDLRDDEWVMPELFRGGANRIHVGGGLDE